MFSTRLPPLADGAPATGTDWGQPAEEARSGEAERRDRRARAGKGPAKRSMQPTDDDAVLDAAIADARRARECVDPRAGGSLSCPGGCAMQAYAGGEQVRGGKCNVCRTRVPASGCAWRCACFMVCLSCKDEAEKRGESKRPDDKVDGNNESQQRFVDETGITSDQRFEEQAQQSRDLGAAIEIEVGLQKQDEAFDGNYELQQRCTDGTSITNDQWSEERSQQLRSKLDAKTDVAAWNDMNDGIDASVMTVRDMATAPRLGIDSRRRKVDVHLNQFRGELKQLDDRVDGNNESHRRFMDGTNISNDQRSEERSQRLRAPGAVAQKHAEVRTDFRSKVDAHVAAHETRPNKLEADLRKQGEDMHREANERVGGMERHHANIAKETSERLEPDDDGAVLDDIGAAVKTVRGGPEYHGSVRCHGGRVQHGGLDHHDGREDHGGPEYHGSILQAGADGDGGPLSSDDAASDPRGDVLGFHREDEELIDGPCTQDGVASPAVKAVAGRAWRSGGWHHCDPIMTKTCFWFCITSFRF